jgi:hypothetical protein
MTSLDALWDIRAQIVITSELAEAIKTRRNAISGALDRQIATIQRQHTAITIDALSRASNQAVYHPAVRQIVSFNNRSPMEMVDTISRAEASQLAKALRSKNIQAILGSPGMSYKDRIGYKYLLQFRIVYRTVLATARNLAIIDVLMVNPHIVTEWEYRAADDTSCHLCQKMTGSRFPVGSGPVPPLHYGSEAYPAPVIHD